MATQPAPQTMWHHVGQMPKLANLLLALGVAALAAAWFSPMLLSPAKGDGKACALQEGKAAESPDDKFRIVTIQPVDFRRQDAICVTVENVVSKVEAGGAKQAEINAAKMLELAETGQRTAEDDSYSAPTPEARATAKQKADVMATRAAAARQKVSDLDAAKAKAGEKRHFVLYLNGKKSPFTADAERSPGQQVLVFRLEDSADASSDLGVFWRNAITKPIIDGRLDAHLALGDADGTGPIVPYVAGEAVVNRVVMYSWTVRVLSSFALLAMLAWLVVLSIRTPLLRVDDTPNSSFSLARVQMMFWLVLVSGGFLYIWFVVGQWLNVMNSSTFALLGISGAAAGAALTIDSARTSPPGTPAPVPMDSHGFFRDIASDGASYIQLQRIQMILWTLILGGIFVWTVLIKLELPAFDSNLLALAGIVNGVYVALKTQEKPPAPAATPAS